MRFFNARRGPAAVDVGGLQALFMKHELTGIALKLMVVALVLLLANPASACSCRTLTVCDLIQMPTLFIGEVIEGGVGSIRDDPWITDAGFVRFRVIEIFRGLPEGTKTVTMKTFLLPGMCSPNPYRPGRTYLVAPGKESGEYADGVCFTGRDVEEAREDVRQVREYFTGGAASRIQGTVAVSDESSLVRYRLGSEETKSLSGVRIATVGARTTYSTVTDADGRYSLPLPAGTYRVRATLDSYSSPPDERVVVPSRGCAVQDFGLSASNRISGTVRDESGKIVPDAQVGLIDLDHAPDASSWPVMATEYTNEKDGSFSFTNIPLGRYLLVYNPMGPRADGLFGAPQESAYYPGNGNRASARVVEVNSTRVQLTELNLVVGKPVAFRSVSITVQFPDGTPMKTAYVHCIGSPLEDGGVIWIERPHTVFSNDDTFRCAVPVIAGCVSW
jgi:hypothetical protein